MSPIAAAAPSTNDVPLWASLLVGIGIGTIVSALMTLIGQGWQRSHELRLEEIRDRQRLRDGRLERLREDLREVVRATYDLDQILHESIDQVSETEAAARVQAVVERFESARSRLVLDPDGDEMTEAVADLAVLVRKSQRLLIRFDAIESPDSADLVDIGTEIREGSTMFLIKRMVLVSQARHLLQQVEQQPLYKRPERGPRWRRKK